MRIMGGQERAISENLEMVSVMFNSSGPCGHLVSYPDLNFG